ncbi:hypothetical protein [Paenibacillus monticola]|uniref:Uncharacterized protein n=1 Tax=Paenibacillus monticola TaxID=2666075 RepID=A0A7X2H5N2_9BACL|nr:hypothetical protein [Paenibacillus monticola]MRN53974.1 hypothetical protein [Paenibacillus monticola]
MKFKVIGKRNKIAGMALASALVVASLGSIAAYAADSNDVVSKNVLITAPVVATSTPAVDQEQGTIQYSKMSYTRADGSQTLDSEYWYNPVTKQLRMDSKEYTADHQVRNYHSSYQTEGQDDMIVIQREPDGHAVSGKIVKAEKPGAERFDFQNEKALYTDNSWTYVGDEQSPDGKTLGKYSQSYRAYINDTTEANIQLFGYADKATGMPVKEEQFEDSTGQAKLFSSTTNEYKYVKDDDGTLFNTNGITLTPVTLNDGVK